MLEKVRTILLSRFKNRNEKEWVSERRGTCLSCECNTLNGGTLYGYKFFLATASQWYSKLTGKIEEDTLGECSICGCSIFYKSAEEEEDCAHEPSKWKSILKK
jgi:hypothetical protein